jgi:lauroyl/myristoyl acyltransferase
MTLARREDLYFTILVGVILAARAAPPFKGPLAEIVGHLAYRLSTAKRRASEAAMRSALGSTWSLPAQSRALRRSFVECWREILGWRPADDATVEGFDHLDAALFRGRGAILWFSNGLGLRDPAGEALRRRGVVLHQVHGPGHLGGLLVWHRDGSWLRRRFIRPFFERRELRWAAGIVRLPADGSLAFTRDLAARLRANGVLLVAGDGREGHSHHTLPFLGTERPFATGMVSLARATGAALLPMFCYRDETGRTRVVIERRIELEGDRESARERAVAHYAARLEAYVRRYPEQYRTWHVLTEVPAGTAAGRP